MATRRECWGEFTNTWDSDITGLHLWYRKGRSDEQHLISGQSLKIGDSTKKFKIKYETGLGSDHAYWWCEFVDGGGTKFSLDKSNFYCEIESEDEGNTVTFKVLPESKEFEVTMSDGDSCTQGLTT